MAGITSIIGDPLQTGAAAAMHKCLVCDKPVNAYDPNAPSSINTRPTTVVVGYDKVDDPRFSAPPSPIKKPSSSHHGSRQQGGRMESPVQIDSAGTGIGSHALSSRVNSPLLASRSDGLLDASPYVHSGQLHTPMKVTMMGNSLAPHNSVATKKLNPIAAKNSAIAQRLRSGAGGGAVGAYKADTR